jgi:hypothetical protein
MIQWGNTPTGSVASIYLPGVSAAEVLTLAAKMYVTHRLTLVDEHTLRCPTGGATWIPVPRGPAANFAGLLTVELPPNVRKGQAFTIVARQVTNTTVTQVGGGQPGRGATVPPAFHERRVLGSFQVTIPVRVAGVLLGPEERLLAIMRFIGESIPRANRWAPVLQRYIAQIALRVEGFGGNPANIPPSGSGSLPSDGGHRY